MIDKVVSTVVVIIVIMVATIIVYTSVFTGASTERSIARQSYEREYGSLLVESLFLSYDNESGLTHEALLARALQEISTEISVRGREVDVEEQYSQVLDSILGEGNYYFEVRPLLKGVSISYILDGSETMRAKRETVSDALPGLKASLTDLFGENASIFTHIYILDTTTSGNLCPEFSVGEGGGCEDLEGDVFYEQLMLAGFNPPVPSPFRSFPEWQFSSVAADTAHLSESDWAAAAAYASRRYQENTRERSLTNKHVIVAVADELSSGSKADECFSLTSQTDVLFCLICQNECPFERADGVVNQTREILERNGDLFIGFHSLECDYAYDDALNGFSLTPYTCQFLDDSSRCAQVKDLEDPDTPPGWTNPPAGVNWCDQENCGGCEPTVPVGEEYCFHRGCDAAIIEDLQEIADATGGLVLGLTDLSLLTDTVHDYFTSQVSDFEFVLGTRNESRDRYVIERSFGLENGKDITLVFWIYD